MYALSALLFFLLGESVRADELALAAEEGSKAGASEGNDNSSGNGDS